MSNKVFLCGDIHGSIVPLARFYKRNKKKINFDGTDVIIFLGDFGGNYFLDERDRVLKRELSKFPFTYFIVRGNHEDRASNCAKRRPNQWYKEKFFENTVWVEDDYPHIKYAMDGCSAYVINNHPTLVLPGAYSVDKYYRLFNGATWFEDEQLNAEEMAEGERLAVINKYDLVLSHTCPINFIPTDLFLPMIDQSLVDKTMEHFFQKLEHIMKYKTWCWGHYHAFRAYPPEVLESGEIKRQIMLSDKIFIELENILNTENSEGIELY